MRKEDREYFTILKGKVFNQQQIVKELNALFKDLENAPEPEERNLIMVQIASLVRKMRSLNREVGESVEKIILAKPLKPKKEDVIELKQKRMLKPIRIRKVPKKYALERGLTEIEWLSLNRIKKGKEEKKEEAIRKPSRFIHFANRLFSDYSFRLFRKRALQSLERDLAKANLEFTPTSYVSVVLLSTLLSAIGAFFLMFFLLFFNLSVVYPFVTFFDGDFLGRFLKVFWIIFAVPIGTFLFMYLYPSMEKGSNADKINQELPFAAIHMAAIAGSMVEPSKIFEIVISTGEYPAINQEFKKVMNEINIYGYDLVSALKKTSSRTASAKLSELLNSLAINITSGGDLIEFFDKKSQSLLFEYKLDRERYTKAAETFMDIYISVVIAAPMILMLLLIMMRVSGLGISLGVSSIGFIMVLIVAVVNLIFISFLHLKQPND